MTNKIKHSMAIAGCVAALISGHASAAEAWPAQKAITWIVGFAPGGSADTLSRLAAKKLGEKLGQSVVVQNITGASGVLGLQAMARAAADGYTIGTISGPTLYGIPVPEVGKDLASIALLAEGPLVIVASEKPGAPADLEGLLEQTKKIKKNWSFASSGVGTSQHLAGEQLNLMAGTTFAHIPYKGGGQAITDVVAGEVTMGILGLTPVLPHIKSGALKAYAVTTKYRLDSLSDIPTVDEAGVPGFDANQWYAVGAPTGVDPQIITRLNSLINEIMSSPDVAATLETTGSVARSMTPGQVETFIKSETEKWWDVAHKAKVTMQ